MAARALWALNRPARRSATGPAQSGVRTPIRSPAASSSIDVARTSAAAAESVADQPCPGRPGRGRERVAGRVVGVDDPDPRPLLGLRWVRAGESLEQAQLGRPVRLVRAVELQVLVAQVREDRRVVGDAADPFGGETVGRRLEDGRPVPAGGHRPEQRLESERARGRHVIRCPLAARSDPGLDGPDQTGRDTGRLEGRRRQERRRRLAVGPGHPDDGQLVARVAIPPGRGRRECSRAPVDDELEAGDPRDRSLDDRRDGAGGRGGDEVVVAVGMVALQRDEHVAGSDPSGVVPQPVHRAAADGPRIHPETDAIAEDLAQSALDREPIDELAEGSRTARRDPCHGFGDRRRRRSRARAAHRPGRLISPGPRPHPDSSRRRPPIRRSGHAEVVGGPRRIGRSASRDR